MKIPPESLFGLLCYAWETPVPPRAVAAASTAADTPLDLFARLLVNGLISVLGRGMERGYREFEGDTRRPRGRVDFQTTVTRNLRTQARVHVRFEELSRDILPNRILCSTMRRLLLVRDLAPSLRDRLIRLLQRTVDVRTIRLHADLFDRVQMHRNNLMYGFLLQVCRLIHRRLIPEGGGEGLVFRDYTPDDRETGLLFEGAVRNFLRIEAPHLRVPRGDTGIRWQRSEDPEEMPLPWMYADIIAGGRADRVLIEVKCVRTPFPRGRPHAAHLYQVSAYLANYPKQDSPMPAVLLYATAGTSFSYRGILQGHHLRIRSLDLKRPWPKVASDLGQFAQELQELARPVTHRDNR